MITVLDVFRALHLEPTKQHTWEAGARTRDAWATLTKGHLPPKDNRQKTNQSGSHCFALYPQTFRPYMEAIIRATQPHPARQGDLFRRPGYGSCPSAKNGQLDLFPDW
jgi:hypothetical protein